MTTIAPTPSRRTSPDEALELWHRWNATGDRRLRDRLVLTYAPLVKFIVFRRLKGMPGHVDVDDYLSCGLEALMHAIDRFDPSHGTTLEQFAWTRIHGAVLDEQRRMDWAPRSVRRRERELAKAEAEFTALWSRPATEAELADALGCHISEIHEIRCRTARADVSSLNARVVSDDGDLEVGDTVVGDPTLDPSECLSTMATRERVREALGRLTAREREVAVLVYAGDLTLREIADRFGVTESRVSQIHSQLKRKLRADLADDAPVLLAA